MLLSRYQLRNSKGSSQSKADCSKLHPSVGRRQPETIPGDIPALSSIISKHIFPFPCLTLCFRDLGRFFVFGHSDSWRDSYIYILHKYINCIYVILFLCNFKVILCDYTFYVHILFSTQINGRVPLTSSHSVAL